jgi:signal transduction histidine kinase
MQHAPSADQLTQDFLPAAARQRLIAKVRATIVLEFFTLFKLQIIPQIASEIAVVWLAWSHADKSHLLVWLFVCLGVHHPFEMWGFLHTKRHGIPEHRIERWVLFFQVISGINSSIMAYAYYAFGIGSPREDLFLLLCAGVMLGVAQYSKADLRTACVGIVPLCVSIASLHLVRGSERDLIVAAFMVLAACASFLMVFQQRKQVFETIYARFLNEELTGILKMKQEEAIKAKEDAETANRTTTRFFVAASHDLRQPLHVLLLLMSSLRLNARDENVQPTLKLMETALGSLKSLFDDLLDITRVESGKTNLSIDAIPVATLFETLSNEFGPLAAAKGLRLRFRTPDVAIMTDGSLLQRILRNLISNAIKYTNQGGILIACRASKNRGAAIQVFDTGIGIPSDQLTSIFEDFYQIPLACGTVGARREGVGLGLGIAKRLADLLGHPIHVRSRPNRGSMFGLRVPISSERSVSVTATATNSETLSFSLSNRSILVVDDDHSVVDAIKILLLNWNAHVITATSKAELQQVLSASKNAPDFLIADFQFEPSFSGKEIIRDVRKRFNVTVPCAIMTGNLSLVPQHVSQLERTHVFAKPVSAAKLRSLLHFNLLFPPDALPDREGVDLTALAG